MTNGSEKPVWFITGCSTGFGRELSVMAYQPEGSKRLHLLRPYLFVEIVNDQGRPAAPGESGRQLGTLRNSGSAAIAGWWNPRGSERYV